jgi:hypothetical protein
VNLALIFPRRRSPPSADSDGTATRRPVRARPSSALPFRSSRRAPHPDLWASATDTRIDERALFQLCHRVALQLIFVSLHTSLDVRRNFPAHSNDSAARRPVRALGTSSTSTRTSSPFASRASRSECAHAVGARPRLSGSGNRVRKQPTIELFSERGHAASAHLDSSAPIGLSSSRRKLILRAISPVIHRFSALPARSSTNFTQGANSPWSSPAPSASQWLSTPLIVATKPSFLLVRDYVISYFLIGTQLHRWRLRPRTINRARWDAFPTAVDSLAT